MIERIIIAILTKLTSWLFEKGLEKLHAVNATNASNVDIDQKLANFKAAYKEAFDGQSITPEQRKKLNQAIADFIRNRGDGGSDPGGL